MGTCEDFGVHIAYAYTFVDQQAIGSNWALHCKSFFGEDWLDYTYGWSDIEAMLQRHVEGRD
eukprot:650385-Amphidinium_carterae.1